MKVWFNHDLLNKDPNQRKKIEGITFEAGYTCSYSCWCPHGNTCKYRGKYTFHNLMVKLNIFMKYTIGWKNFHIPIHFQKHYSDLTGTIKCPHHLPRKKDCYRCIYSGGIRDCNNEYRAKMIREGRYDEIDGDEKLCCTLFEPCEWFNEYDRKTGDLIF